MTEPILLVSTPTVEGRPPVRVCGYVSANAVWEAVHLANRRFKEAWEDGRYGIYEAVMDRLERAIRRDIKAQARKLGANAVVGFTVRHGTAPLLRGAGAVFMTCEGDRWCAHGEGTAVLIDGFPSPQP